MSHEVEIRKLSAELTDACSIWESAHAETRRYERLAMEHRSALLRAAADVDRLAALIHEAFEKRSSAVTDEKERG